MDQYTFRYLRSRSNISIVSKNLIHFNETTALTPCVCCHGGQVHKLYLAQLTLQHTLI